MFLILPPFFNKTILIIRQGICHLNFAGVYPTKVKSKKLTVKDKGTGRQVSLMSTLTCLSIVSVSSSALYTALGRVTSFNAPIAARTTASLIFPINSITYIRRHNYRFELSIKVVTILFIYSSRGDL